MATQADKINKLDKDIAVIKVTLTNLRENHMYHIEKDVAMLKKTLWAVGFLVFSNLVILLRDLLL